MDFQREQILKNALEDKDVKVLVEHNQITAEILSKEVLSIYSYMINKKKCAGCTSLNNCQQDIIGSMPKINYNGNIYTEYVYINSGWEIIGSTDIDLSNYLDRKSVV